MKNLFMCMLLLLLAALVFTPLAFAGSGGNVVSTPALAPIDGAGIIPAYGTLAVIACAVSPVNPAIAIGGLAVVIVAITKSGSTTSAYLSPAQTGNHKTLALAAIVPLE